MVPFSDAALVAAYRCGLSSVEVGRAHGVSHETVRRALYRTGTPVRPRKWTHEQRVAAFWARVDRRGNNDCWPWTGPVAKSGYGVVSTDHKSAERAHRAAFLYANGWLPRGLGGGALLIRHSCDNRICCNPAHLSVGTHGDNMRDAVERNRMSRVARFVGADHPRSKLCAADVVEARSARAAGASIAALARRFGVSRTSMDRALSGKTWGHVK